MAPMFPRDPIIPMPVYYDPVQQYDASSMTQSQCRVQLKESISHSIINSAPEAISCDVIDLLVTFVIDLNRTFHAAKRTGYRLFQSQEEFGNLSLLQVDRSLKNDFVFCDIGYSESTTMALELEIDSNDKANDIYIGYYQDSFIGGHFNLRHGRNKVLISGVGLVTLRRAFGSGSTLRIIRYLQTIELQHCHRDDKWSSQCLAKFPIEGEGPVRAAFAWFKGNCRISSWSTTNGSLATSGGPMMNGVPTLNGGPMMNGGMTANKQHSPYKRTRRGRRRTKRAAAGKTEVVTPVLVTKKEASIKTGKKTKNQRRRERKKKSRKGKSKMVRVSQFSFCNQSIVT